MQTTRSTSGTTTEAYEGYGDTHGWGWLLFAGSMLMLGGVFNIIDGLVAIYQSNYYKTYLANRSLELPVTNNLHYWGWVAFGAGIVMVCAGFAVFSNRTWARIVGMVIAGLNMIFQLAFLASFPFWSFTMIIVDILVIYGLAVGGRRATV